MANPQDVQATIQPGNSVQDLSLVPGTSGTYTGTSGPFTAVTAYPGSGGAYVMIVISSSGATVFNKTGTPTDNVLGSYTSVDGTQTGVIQD